MNPLNLIDLDYYRYGVYRAKRRIHVRGWWWPFRGVFTVCTFATTLPIAGVGFVGSLFLKDTDPTKAEQRAKRGPYR